MRRLILTFLLTLTLLGLLAACLAPGGSGAFLSPIFPDQNEPLPILPPPADVELAIDSPVHLNQPVPITITVHTNTDVVQLQARLDFGGMREPLIEGEREWLLGDVPAGHTLQLTSTLIFPEERPYHVIADVYSDAGLPRSTGLRINFEGDEGLVLYPSPAEPRDMPSGPPQPGTPVFLPDALPSETPPTPEEVTPPSNP